LGVCREEFGVVVINIVRKLVILSSILAPILASIAYADASSDWIVYKNNHYHYTISYPPGAHVESEELDAQGHRVPKSLADVSKIIIILPTINWPTIQGGTSVNVSATYALRIKVFPNPDKLSLKEWWERLPGKFVIEKENITFHEMPAIKAKYNKLAGEPDSCLFIDKKWVYEICYEHGIEEPKELYNNTSQIFERMLQSFKIED
jgi:hypothetical protein